MQLNTNGGSLTSNQKCEVPIFGEAWFNDRAVTNILSYAEVADNFRITYDNTIEDTFIVHLPKGELRFVRSPSGLYYWKPKPVVQPLSINNEAIFVTTVEENKKFYSERQYEQAKRARDFYHAMGTPSIKDLLAALRMNLIKNNPVTLEHVLSLIHI